MSPTEIIETAFARYERPLLSYAREITGDIETARDTVQETFLRLSKQNLPTLQDRLAPWLFCVCRNCALDHRRKIIRLADQPSTDKEEPADTPPPSAQAVANEDTLHLRTLIRHLPEKQRQLLKLKFEAGLSYKEMAHVMSMSVSHVGVVLHEAIQTLRKQWNQPNPNPETITP